jgi:hypothetical protein
MFNISFFHAICHRPEYIITSLLIQTRTGIYTPPMKRVFLAMVTSAVALLIILIIAVILIAGKSLLHFAVFPVSLPLVPYFLEFF